jgi:hypothetical protein
VVSAAAAWHDLRALVLDRFDRRAEVTAAPGLSSAPCPLRSWLPLIAL